MSTEPSAPVKTCAAIGCAAKISPMFFMCPKHWHMVPRVLRVEIWSTRGKVGAGINAGRRAIVSVAEQERASAGTDV